MLSTDGLNELSRRYSGRFDSMLELCFVFRRDYAAHRTQMANRVCTGRDSTKSARDGTGTFANSLGSILCMPPP